MSILVMKFGGTSVGDPQAVQRSAALAAAQRTDHQVVVVVSALAGITNLLLEGARESALDREQVGLYTHKFLIRHEELIAALELDEDRRGSLLKRIKSNSILLYNLFFYVYQSGQPLTDLQDEILSLGELTSASIFTALLQNRSIAAEEIDARQIIRTDSNFTCARVSFPETNRNIRQFVSQTLSQNRVAVIPGFVGRSKDGHTTTLGRGASDYSASIIAAALDAEEIWNWTDVDGVLNIDPRVIPAAEVIPSLSYEEMAQLAARGAKVLHPDSVAPLIQKHIPLRVKNSFKPQQPGTLIQADAPAHGNGPLAIGLVHPTDRPDQVEINIVRSLTSTRRIRAILAQYHIPFISWTENRADDCITLTVHPHDEARAVQSLFENLFSSPAPSTETSASSTVFPN